MLTIILSIVVILSLNSQAKEVNIVCTNTALEDFTSNLLTENATIEYIMPPGVCPAFYDTKPSDIDKILSADIIISLGSTKMESWLSNLITYNPDVDIIECKDLGEWNIPSGAKTFVQCISNELSFLLPEKNSSIRANAEIYMEQIDEKAKELQEIIENNGALGKEVICMQWQEDFLEWLGLNVVYSYGPPQGLSVQDEIDIINAASTNNINVIIDNLQSGTDFGSRVASESGASHVIFSNFPGAIPGTDTYLDMITYNIEQLLNGISTYEYKQGDIVVLEEEITNLELQRNASLITTAIFVILALILFVLYKKK
jgi:ABC-type Zn uptake system ZnuABC Zn-binding protein ZnuA